MAAKINDWGIKTLAVWLLLQGLHQVFDLSFDGFYMITGILALIAGILILMGK